MSAPTAGRTLTPARAQYFALKQQHPDALLLFRMGDFYETFDADAETVAAVTGVALTSRPMGKSEGRVPLAGVPYHALERYLDQLVAAGHRVAIVEQVSPPGRGLVERRVVRVVTPGTVEAGALLEERGHNWLVALAPEGPAEARWGLAACDVTTGEFVCQLVSGEELAGEWARLQPREALLPEEAALPAPPADTRALITRRPARWFAPVRAAETLRERLGARSLDGFGLEGLDPAVRAAGALVAYLAESWPDALRHLRAPRALRAADAVYLDPQTRRNLELFAGRQSGAGSLVEVLDRTLTPGGGRLLRARLGQPSRQRAVIEARLDEVEAFVRAPLTRLALRRELRGMPDLERLLGRVRAGTASARQLVLLRRGIERLPALAACAADAGPGAASAAGGLLGPVEAAAAIAVALSDDPPADPGDGGTVREGFDAEVDELRELSGNARSALLRLEATERARTGLGALKVGFNRVFGYYWELPQSQAGRAPEEYEPRQTLVNARRFRSAELSALETRILEARERLAERERALLDRVRAQVADVGPAIERAAEAVARLDVAAALAEVAADSRHVRPELAEQGPFEIVGGRHPVVEAGLPAGAFVANDCALGDGADIVVLTGPNMGGKSTYLRQVALIALLAQCGAFVPAERARVPLVDRIFTRVGAQDDLAAGQSTFMVEMLETAAILHGATERSLVILDEVGRGTSTQDGLAIARAVIEYLHHRPGGSPRTLFATHYQELVGLAALLPRVANASVAVQEEAGEVVFLHRIVPGAADRSYGVHVAALAGLPRPVVARARELLRELEAAVLARPALPPPPTSPLQPSLLAGRADDLLEELAELDPDALTPIEALQRLYELRGVARRRLALEG
ncbi:MAG: DNA mismatch repair protein MutS [Dehalococcoidia bacterium]